MKYARQCTQCKCGINEGYVVNGEQYYCSDKCVHEVYTPIEWEQMSVDDSNECYWTDWQEENQGYACRG